MVRCPTLSCARSSFSSPLSYCLSTHFHPILPLHNPLPLQTEPIMSMETKTDPSASASTTGSLGSDPTDPAVVALMDRLQSRDAKDHASFIMTLYGTDSEL